MHFAFTSEISASPNKDQQVSQAEKEHISKAMQFPSVWLLRWKKKNVKSTGNFNTANQRVENQKLQKTLPKANYLFASLLLGVETWWLKLQSANVQSLVGSEQGNGEVHSTVLKDDN